MRFPLRDTAPRADLRSAAKRGISALLLLGLLAGVSPAQAPRLRVLFLGDDGHHRPAERFRQVAAAFARRGIELTYTDKLADLNAANLGKYDALLVYANHTRISPQQEK